MILFLDIETNTAHDTIWMCYTYDEENGFVCHTAPLTLMPLIEKADTVVGHNLIGFDAQVLNRCWRTNLTWKKLTDTLVMSRLLNPDIDGGHSLEAWGKRLGRKKSDYQRIYWRLKGKREYDSKDLSHWNNPNIPLMMAYCRRDVKVLVELYRHISPLLDAWKTEVKNKSNNKDYLELEHEVAWIIKQQEQRGFLFDEHKAMRLLHTLQSEVSSLVEQLQVVFPPIITERYSAKTGKKLKDDVQEFNPGSRQQIAERLQQLGVKFDRITEKGSTVVNEEVLASIDIPEAKMINRYLLLQKRISQVSSWVDAVKKDGAIHGGVITNGAVTGRMTHRSPNMAQIPNSGSEFGPECRDCFIARPGYTLVGADASGLELRMLAHYMGSRQFIETVVSGSSKDGTDIHTINQKAAGLSTRDQAKTFIYAFLYGAGPAKIGSIVGGDAAVGKKLIAKFLKNTPALAALRTKVTAYADKGYMPGLDGRKVFVRSEHAALNTLLQSAGAIVMKKALTLLDNSIKSAKIDAHFVANVHDEWQIEVEVGREEEVGKMAVKAIEDAGIFYNLNCPLTGEWNAGLSWKETH